MTDHLPAVLNVWMLQNVTNFAGPATWSRFAGGQSNPTYRVDTPHGPFVLRRQPQMAIAGAHAVHREFRFITALAHAGFPVPQAHALCTDRSILDGMFYVMELVEGDVHWSGLLPEFDLSQRYAVHRALIEVLARLHRLDWEAAGFADIVRPGSYAERQLDRWTLQLGAAGAINEQLLPLAGALRRSLPAVGGQCLVHGDYRIDNIIFRTGRPDVAAVIDWELATIGDPLVDFTYFLVAWVLPAELGGMGGVDLEALGIPSIDQAARIYADATGRTDIPDFDWHMAFNLFRVAAMCEGIVARARAGNAANSRALDIGERIAPLVLHARIFAERAGIWR